MFAVGPQLRSHQEYFNFKVGKKQYMKISKSKIIKITIYFLILIIIIFVAYYILLIKGFIPFPLQDKIDHFVGNVYTHLRFDKIFGKIYPYIRIIVNYPNRLYLVKNTKNVKEYYGWSIIDYDYSLLFISADNRYLTKTEEINKTNIISKKPHEYITDDEKKEEIEDMVLLKIGCIWEQPYDELYLKIYNSGKMIFDYIWHDYKKAREHLEWKLNIISITIPVNKEKINSIVRQLEIQKFDKLFTIDSSTLGFGGKKALDLAMVVKKGDKIKIIYRDPCPLEGDELKHAIREFWSRVIAESELRERIVDLICKEYPNELEMWQLEGIIHWLGIFKNKNCHYDLPGVTYPLSIYLP
jgi:hypothetical protein